MHPDPETIVSHRPWPLPDRPWVMHMHWHDLLFAHWPVRPEAVRPLVPAQLELDLFDGWAWIGVVPFGMKDVRARIQPRGLALAFPELNVRTYVRTPGRSGVWFFSLDAASRLAVRGARFWYNLPYFDADMALRKEADTVHYFSKRTHRGAAPAAFEASYRPTGPVFAAAPGSFDHWATERYALYSAFRSGRVGIGDIHHKKWPLQPADAEITHNSMLQPLGLSVPESEPILHFARELDVRAWTVKPLV